MADIKLLRQAAAVLESNDRGDFTVPAAGLYPYQWLWDAGFIALGWAVLREQRAWQELFSLFRGQRADGFVPHIVFHRPDSSYFPGPEAWGAGGNPPTSGITQPPILATVVYLLYRVASDREVARRAARMLLPRLLAFHRWLYRARDPDGTGLVSILHPWESGMDNSPAWDDPLHRVPDSVPVELRRRDTVFVPADERPLEDEYRRYMALVHQFRAVGYDPNRLYIESPFCVVDVGFNAVLHRANLDLMALADDLGEPTEELEAWVRHGQEAFGSLWSSQEAFFFSLDRRSGELLRVPTCGGLLALYARIASPCQATRLVEHLNTWSRNVSYLVPSTDPSHPRFEPRRYWRGPVWLNINWMVSLGLQEYGFHELEGQVRRHVIALVNRSGFREYYDPLTGAGLGGRDFSWSAAVVLWWETQKATLADK